VSNDSDEKDNVINLKPKTKAKAGRRKANPDDALTVKQERFARLLAAGHKFDAAYRQTYNVSNMQADSVYKKAFYEKDHPKIVARVKQLREQAKQAENTQGILADEVRDIVQYKAAAIADVIVNRKFLMDKALQAYNRADELGQSSAMVAAVGQLGKLSGIISDDRESRQVSDLDRMDVAQLKAFISQQIGELSKIGLFDGDFNLIAMDPDPKLIN
jgi:hypothetical protein